MQLSIETPDDMVSLGVTLGEQLRAGDLVILNGPLGAGKTQLTRGIGEGLNIRGPVTSPTFVIARTHPSLGDGPALVHVDAYRLANALEVDDLDIDTVRSVVVAEWGAGKFVDTHESWLEIDIVRPTSATAAHGDSADENPDDIPIEPRTVTIQAFGPRWAKGVSL
jgi:tRNA threonylcarbamoyl adenosine modification protein YjeE